MNTTGGKIYLCGLGGLAVCAIVLPLGYQTVKEVAPSAPYWLRVLGLVLVYLIMLVALWAALHFNRFCTETLVRKLVGMAALLFWAMWFMLFTFTLGLKQLHWMYNIWQAASAMYQVYRVWLPVAGIYFGVLWMYGHWWCNWRKKKK